MFIYLLRENVIPKVFHKLEPVYRNEQNRKTETQTENEIQTLSKEVMRAHEYVPRALV